MSRVRAGVFIVMIKARNLFGHAATVLAAGLFGAGAARAAESVGAPKPWEMGFQPAASPSAAHMSDFHTLLLYIITAIVVFVTALLLYVLVRFNARAHPVPSPTTHNTMLEVLWTVIPVVILLVIAVPSFKLLYFADRTHTPEMTLKVTGKQWFWSYEYPDHGDVAFDSYMLKDNEIDPAKGNIRLLSTDNPVVLPVDTDIQILLTSADVIHSWAVPSLGLKTDAVPGRNNETWVRIDRPGTYFGQCSELCGKDHAYMPVEIKAVTKDEFAAWIAGKGGKMPGTAASQDGALPAPAAAP